MTGLVVIRIPGEPFAQPRARAAVIDGRAVIYDPKKARNWKATAQGHMLEALGGPDLTPVLLGPVEIAVLAVFTCPKSDHRKREPLARRWHTKKPDADNVIKAVKDSAKGILWLDDSQVCRESCEKLIGAQGEAPFVEIRLRPVVGATEPRDAGFRNAEAKRIAEALLRWYEEDTGEETFPAAIKRVCGGGSVFPAQEPEPADQPALFEERP